MKAREALRFFGTLRVVPTVTVDLTRLRPLLLCGVPRLVGHRRDDRAAPRAAGRARRRAQPAARRLLRRVPGGDLARSAPAGADALDLPDAARGRAPLCRKQARDDAQPVQRQERAVLPQRQDHGDRDRFPRRCSPTTSEAQFDRTNRGIGDETVERLLAVTDGHPYATQELAFALWDLVPEGFTATVTDVEAALEAVLRSENARFALVWENATQPQRLLLQALAAEPGRAVQQRLPRRARVAAGLGSAAGARAARRRTSSCARHPRASTSSPSRSSREWVLGYAS